MGSSAHAGCGLVITHGLLQVRVLSQAYPGIMHATVFWGFLALFMGTVLATIDYDITLPLLGVKLLKGSFYLFYELVLDLFGLFFVVGLGMACYRRFIKRSARVDPDPKFAYALLILFVINVTGFVMEACRLAVVKPWWAPWSPVGYALGQVFLGVGLGEGALRGLYLGSLAVPRRGRARLHRADPALVLHALHHHPAQHLLLQARAPRRHRQDREHRGGGEPRRLEVRGVLLEAAARFRRLRGVRPLPGRVPRLHVRAAR